MRLENEADKLGVRVEDLVRHVQLLGGRDFRRRGQRGTSEKEPIINRTSGIICMRDKVESTYLKRSTGVLFPLGPAISHSFLTGSLSSVELESNEYDCHYLGEI